MRSETEPRSCLTNGPGDPSETERHKPRLPVHMKSQGGEGCLTGPLGNSHCLPVPLNWWISNRPGTKKETWMHRQEGGE